MLCLCTCLSNVCTGTSLSAALLCSWKHRACARMCQALHRRSILWFTVLNGFTFFFFGKICFIIFCTKTCHLISNSMNSKQVLIYIKFLSILRFIIKACSACANVYQSLCTFASQACGRCPTFAHTSKQAFSLCACMLE